MGFFSAKSPKLNTYSTIQDWQKELGKTMAGAFGGLAPEMLSRLFEREDMASIISEFTESVATPLMKMWKKDIAPMVAEGFNMFPGSFYSKSRFTGMQREGEEFLSGKISPLLFSSLEQMRSREFGRQQLIASALGLPVQLSTAGTIGGQVVGGTPSQFSQIFGSGGGYEGASSAGGDIAALLMMM